MRERFKRYLKKHVLHLYDCAISFSTNGQDLLLNYLFFFKNNGVYIDIGAHHPHKGSNSYLFYLKGWRGINIDPLPGCMKEFQKIRPHDINLEIGVAQVEGTLPFYLLPNQESMSTCSPAFLQQMGIDHERLEKIEVNATPLNGILEKHWFANVAIDVLMIDVEGFELEVLRSNDWSKYRPIVVMTEHLHEMSADIYQNEIVQYLSGQNYRLISKTPSELFFLDNSYDLHPTGVIERFLLDKSIPIQD